MSNNMNPHEERVFKNQFPNCDNSELREDIIFVCPSVFKGNIKYIADKLQSAADFLKCLTGINPKDDFQSRVFIGFTDQSNQPNWSGRYGNRIHIPERYLNKEMEPLGACSHELVHPYYRCSPLHNSNEKWGECFCEFLRGPVKNVMGLDGNSWWQEKIEDTRSNTQNDGNVAGQFILKAKKRYGGSDETEIDFIDRFIEDPKAIKDFVSYLFSFFSERQLSSEFNATSKMRWV